MILMDEMLPLKLYSSKQRAYLPFNPTNKKKNARITLLTRSMRDSIDLINTPFFMNPNYFISYYMDRNVKRYLSNDGNIQIEGEEEDPDEEAVNEAVMRLAPGKKSPVCVFVSGGSKNDMVLLEKYFHKKQFDEAYDYFRIRKNRRKYPAVYGCNNMKEMFDAIGGPAIMQHGKLITNSYNDDEEIFVLNNSEYAFENSDGPYELYCKSALYTYVINVSCPKCTWELANSIASAVVGQAQYIYKKNNYKFKDEKIQAAVIISQMDEKDIIAMAHDGNPHALASHGAKNLLKKFTNQDLKEEAYIFAEDVIDDMRHLKNEKDLKSCMELAMKSKLSNIPRLRRPDQVNQAILQAGYTAQNQEAVIADFKRQLKELDDASDDNKEKRRIAMLIVDHEDYKNWLLHDYTDMLRQRLSEVNNESALLESDGSQDDTIFIMRALNKKDREFVSSDGSYDDDKSSRAIYRHIERDGEGLYKIKGFVEVHRYPRDIAPFVVIAVHPAFRQQGVGEKLVKTMLKEFHEEHPEENALVWRAEAKNKKSIALAQKMGFKVVKENSNGVTLRYDYKENKIFALIPDEIKNEKDLIKYCRDRFSLNYNEPTDQLYRIRDLKEIVRSKKINKFELGYFTFVALRKMGYAAIYNLIVECNGTAYGLGDIEPMVWFITKDTYIVNPMSPTFGKEGIIKVRDTTNLLKLYNVYHGQGRWGDPDNYPVTACTKQWYYEYEIEPGQYLYPYYVIPQIKEMFPEGSPIITREQALLEFTTRSKLEPPEQRNNLLPANLNRLKAIKIDKAAVDKYGKKMEGLHHVRLTNSCTGVLYVNKKDEPVCYYNVQHKDADDTGNDSVWLQAVEVSEDYQGKSLGRQLVEKAVNDHHVTNLSVHRDNAVAVRLYRSMGFEPYITNGDMIMMQKDAPKMESWRPPEGMTMMLEDQVFVFTEALSQTAYNTKLKKYLWKERVRTSSAQIAIFEQIKTACPKIRKTFINPKMYRGLNIFLDMSYYNGLFLAHNTTTKDIAINFYWEYMNRMINSTDEYFRTTYTKNTIFIPVWKGAWDCKEKTFIYDWKDNLNPISVIFRMIRKNPNELKKWSNMNFIFIGRNGYFRVDFSKFQMKDLVKFKTRLNKLWNMEPIEDDEEEDGYGRKVDADDEEHSSSAIAVKVIDDLEKSTGIEVNDVSKAVKPIIVADDKNDPTTLEIVPNLRIRTSPIPIIGNPTSIGVLVPTTDDVVSVTKDTSVKLSKTMKYVYKP